MIAALAAAGWPLYAPLREVWRRWGDREGGQREIFVQDPDGYLVMVAETSASGARRDETWERIARALAAPRRRRRARGLEEDLGRAGDITSVATIPAKAEARAVIVARKPGVLAGLAARPRGFPADRPCHPFRCGARRRRRACRPVTVVAQIAGNARAILTAERVALNFLCHLSGIATATAGLAASIAHTQARICDTRKTTPGLRAFEKYAVRCGGGVNHRFGLDDAILIKDNHIAVAGGVAKAIREARTFAGHLVKIEVEVDTLDQLAEAIGAAGRDPSRQHGARQLREAVASSLIARSMEASGGDDARHGRRNRRNRRRPDLVRLDHPFGARSTSPSTSLCRSPPALPPVRAVQAEKKKR